jgi:squalene synthase HpnC
MIQKALSHSGLGVGHYENFPVGSLILPKKFRRPVRVIYAFAREADDVADEGSCPDANRLEQLKGFRTQLTLIEKGQTSDVLLFRELSAIIREFRLPLQPFHDLLDAFTQDVTKTRYANFGEVMAYCRKSANPIGRLLLALYGDNDRRDRAYADAICSSLQLINFLQDIPADFRKGRIYLPLDEMEEFGITEDTIARAQTSGLWQPFMHKQIDRVRTMLAAGAPLGARLEGRVGLELRMIILGGEVILRKLFNNRGDVFNERPMLRARDWTYMLSRALVRRRR